MTTKEQRRVAAERHMGLVRGVFFKDTDRSLDGAHVYEEGAGAELELPSPKFDETEVSVSWEPLAPAIAKAGGKVCVVDPANFSRPGGNYLAGAWDPESQICAESNLYAILEGLKENFHDINRQSGRGGLNSDRAVYVEDVVFTTDGVMRKRDVLVISPVNRRLALENQRSESECDADMANRIEALLRIAATHQPDTLVLNAFGCGFPGNDDATVANLFKDWLDAHPGAFGKVVFAIPGGPSLDAFREVFPEEEAELRPATLWESDEEKPGEGLGVEAVSDGRWVFD